jgi:hypothetical protein
MLNMVTAQKQIYWLNNIICVDNLGNKLCIDGQEGIVSYPVGSVS